MKKILSAFAMLSVFAACNNSNPNEGANNMANRPNSISTPATDRASYIETEAINDDDFAERRTSGSFTDEGKVIRYEVYKPTAEPKAPVKRSTGSTASKNTTVRNKPVSSSGPVSAPVAQTKRKKGWSSAAKGTAIGAGSGAILGAVISKKKGKGAIIGGVIGAGAGYAIGRAKDKKTGRY
ncbi:YMGG-like glycine zipper-containing protein [Segetibacter sp. 3557_3]|uniref:YMGG-like glycine zipper-containing protein n=1 Tax=Segetibacter sp. 3557_3 TaxID=2547429 RepID=UPI001A9FFA79|nr:YMGG-like glycine zipper-containing protein [Segetibacter sp. 3557_3]